jgi:hypothetical protein
MNRRRNSERGSALLITMIVITSLLAGAAAITGMQLMANRSTEVSRANMSATYCAEAGLIAARATVAANYTLWASALGSSSEPSWLSGAFSHDLDGNPANDPDFTITLKDDDDEQTGANDLTKDNDLRVFVVSTCKLYPETPKQVQELVEYRGGGTCYDAQEGGCGANGNGN